MSNFGLTAAQVRDYLNVQGTTTNYSEGILGSNLNMAGAMLEKMTNRLFTQSSNLTKVFSTEGRSRFVIPDLRSAQEIRWQDSALTEGENVYLIPDSQNTGVYVGINLPFLEGMGGGLPSDWWDRNYRHRSDTRPNDLEIVNGNWGHLPYPPDLLRVTTIYAAWLTRRANSLLANVAQDATGALLDYSAVPPEVRMFVDQWRVRASSGIASI